MKYFKATLTRTEAGGCCKGVNDIAVVAAAFQFAAKKAASEMVTRSGNLLSIKGRSNYIERDFNLDISKKMLCLTIGLVKFKASISITTMTD